MVNLLTTYFTTFIDLYLVIFTSHLELNTSHEHQNEFKICDFNAVINRDINIKYLRIYIGKLQKLSIYIKYINIKVSKTIYKLEECGTFLPLRTLNIIYTIFIKFTINYGIVPYASCGTINLYVIFM